MARRLDWLRIGVGSIAVGAVLMVGWEFLLEGPVFAWLGIQDRAGSLHEKIVYIAMGAVAAIAVVIGVLMLVSEGLVAAQELYESEERFRLVFQESPGLFAMSRASDGLHYDVNEQWLKVLGYSRAEVIGRTAAEIGVWPDPDDRRRLIEALAMNASLRNFETRLRTKNGRVLPVLIAVEKVRVEDEERLLIVAQEITELKRVEEALRASERQLRGILDNMQDIYYRTDREGRFIKVSPAIREMLGYTAEESLGRRVAEFYWNPEEEKAFRAAMKSNGGRIREHEMKFRHRDGHPVWLWTNGQYLYDESGAVMGIEGTSRDITERKTAEAAMRQAHDDLEIRVQERTRELKDALDKVSEASRAKSDFLANMSHELRTPMNAILGFSDMLAKEALGPMGNPRYREYAADIYNSGQHLLALINELLDLARIESRTLELRDDTVDIKALIRSAIHMSERSAESAGGTVRILGPENLPKIRGDELRLTQVFLNLIGNARKFTPPDGQVDIRCAPTNGGGIEVVIADTGPGIAPEDIERVQIPFARGRGAFIRTKEGLGLGLPLAKAFMEAHGGTLRVASTPGQGTMVTLNFPAPRIVSG